MTGSSAGLASRADDHRLRVLLVEDDDVSAEAERLLLEASGLSSRVTVVESCSAAVSVLLADRFDVVLADLSLPDAEGLDVVERCHGAAPEVPIVVITACRDDGVALDGLTVGAQDYLVKGEFDHHDLARAIRYARARARGEAELRDALHRLESSNRQLEDYARIASHDLRAPVRTARVIASRLMTLPGVAAEKGADELGAMLGSGLARLETMLQGLLDYAQAGDVSSDREDVALRPLADSVIDDLAADLDQAGGRVQLVGDVILHGHRPLLRSLLANLVQNAVKYRSDHDLLVSVEARPTSGGTVLIRVIDNGIGIEPQFRARVFTMFERLSTAGEGIGLGLSLCHRVVALHGGRIWIEDGAGGVGTAVCFTLPGRPCELVPS